jgi:phosphoglycolate phosphatase
MDAHLPSPALVVFDLDGTLIDSAPDLCAAVAAALGEVGLPPHNVDAIRRMIGEGQRVLIERAVSRAGGTGQVDVDDVLRRFRRYYSEHLVVTTTLYPGARELLDALSHHARLPLALATNKPGAWARRIIEHFGLLPYFHSIDHVLGEDDVGARKPDPRLLLTHCERLGIAPEQTLLVGDSAIDWQTAQRAGCQFAYCTFGFGDSDTLTEIRARAARSEPPHGSAERPYVVDSLVDLLGLEAVARLLRRL